MKRYKRVDHLVRAIAALQQDFPNIRLDLVGDGDALPGVLALAESLGVQERVVARGHVSEREKRRLLATATVFANPSSNEGWGLSIIEANSFGCPAVAYDVPGLSASIRHNESGLLARDDTEFVACLAAILRDDALRARLSRGARRWAARFDWDHAAAATLDFLYHYHPAPVARVAS